MEVIGAGWGRTGTMSLKVALDELGLPCYHMVECFKHHDHPEQWMHAADGHPVDFRQLLDRCGYKACTDWPPATFYKQLMEVYPNAKVILSVRNPNKWYESMKETVWQMRQALSDLPWYVAPAHKLMMPGRSRAVDMVGKLVWEHDLQGCFADDPGKAKELFKQHIEEVKQAVPAEKLLVFEVSQGWAPLCKFLGKPVPQHPFPHVNEREEWRKRLQAVRRLNAGLTYGVPATAVAVVAAGVAVGRLLLQRARHG